MVSIMRFSGMGALSSVKRRPAASATLRKRTAVPGSAAIRRAAKKAGNRRCIPLVTVHYKKHDADCCVVVVGHFGGFAAERADGRGCRIATGTPDDGRRALFRGSAPLR